ncbi:hypothetical protein CRG98_050127 [Punica granatum]|uniref:Uncharacterized protein n=1 Tax=Punica granatum TaxID=22663 RepID=A0A2I0GT11_PUNGR|nr:hypothetical protein CRG98_050127 [Punica granatum]
MQSQGLVAKPPTDLTMLGRSATAPKSVDLVGQLGLGEMSLEWLMMPIRRLRGSRIWPLGFSPNMGEC